VNALRNIQAVLSPLAVLVDTQPVSARPRVTDDISELGRLEMGDWVKTIHAVDERTDQVMSAGLFDLQHEETFVVTDSFDAGIECLETAASWRDTQVPHALAARLKRTTGVVTVEQEVRLRLLRRRSV
jgi:hypothetical protein